MKKILPILLALIGIAAGIGAGIALKPAAHDTAEINPCGDPDPNQAHAGGEPAEDVPSDKEYVKLNNQFVVPVVQDNRVVSLVVMALSVETKAGTRETVYAREPKLRDVFLQVLFDHANMGGFLGSFTSTGNMTILRNALKSEAIKALGKDVTDVLITDILRQDV